MLFKTNAGSLLKYLLLLQNVLAGRSGAEGGQERSEPNRTSKPRQQRRSEVSNEKPRVRAANRRLRQLVRLLESKVVSFCLSAPLPRSSVRRRPAFLAVHSNGHSAIRGASGKGVEKVNYSGSNFV